MWGSGPRWGGPLPPRAAAARASWAGQARRAAATTSTAAQGLLVATVVHELPQPHCGWALVSGVPGDLPASTGMRELQESRVQAGQLPGRRSAFVILQQTRIHTFMVPGSPWLSSAFSTLYSRARMSCCRLSTSATCSDSPSSFWFGRERDGTVLEQRRFRFT